jgi:hypothetical protein
VIEQETCDALVAICETLKAEYRYLSSLQGRLVWLDQTVRKSVPAVASSTEKIPFEPHPETAAQIQLIDALLEKLQKS